MQLYAKPVRIISSPDGKKTSSRIIDAEEKGLINFPCPKEVRDVLAPLIKDLLNKPDKEEESVSGIPTSSVYSRSDQEGFLGKCLVAPMSARVDEGTLKIVVTFDDEMDCVWEWKSEFKNDSWDSRVVEVVALMDLICIRADQMASKVPDPDEFVSLFVAQLRHQGFKLLA